MIDHNKEIFKLIKHKRNKLKYFTPQTLEGQEVYHDLIKLYGLLDIDAELVQDKVEEANEAFKSRRL